MVFSLFFRYIENHLTFTQSILNYKNLALFLVLLAFSCKSDDNGNIIDTTPIFLHTNALSGDGEEGITKQNLVITEAESWNELMAQMNSLGVTQSPDITVEEINFTDYQVIAIFDEVRPECCHSIALNITSNSENIIVQTTFTPPPSGTLPSVSQVYYMAKILKSDLPIVFEE